jgi:hypothetical protein
VNAYFFAFFLVVALLWSSSIYVRARQARRGRPFPLGTFVFGSCLFLGLVLGVALGEVAGFVTLGLSVGAVAGGILGAMNPLSHSTKALGSPPSAGVGDRDLDRQF